MGIVEILGGHLSCRTGKIWRIELREIRRLQAIPKSSFLKCFTPIFANELPLLFILCNLRKIKPFGESYWIAPRIL